MIDADTENQRKTAMFSLRKRPCLPKPFSYYTSAEWDLLPNPVECKRLVIDTSKSPTNGVQKIVKKNSDLVLIPCQLTEKSWNEGAKPAIESMKSAGVRFAIVPNHYADGDKNKLYNRLEAINAPIIHELPHMPALPEIIDNGMLPQYASNEEKAQWNIVKHQFYQLAAEVESWLEN